MRNMILTKPTFMMKLLTAGMWLLYTVTSVTTAQAQRCIYIYAGPGASTENIRHLQYMLNAVVDLSQYSIQTIDAADTKYSSWEIDTALLIMPGGADLPYMHTLNGIGNQKIRDFVNNGGSYLGICAGAYYSGSYVSFALKTAIEVKGPRELAFFEGTVEGPLLAPYDYRSNSGCRAAKLTWEGLEGFEEGTQFEVFYNGGGYFEATPQNQGTYKTLANYGPSFDSKPAIIEVKVGSGTVILSGPHWEYSPMLLDSTDLYFKELIPVLLEANDQRLLLAKHLLKRLGIQTR